MKHLYHLCGGLLDKGSIILPGSYGHIIKNVYGRNESAKLGNPHIILCEEKLEQYRKLHTPEKPSRLHCVFACHSIENLKAFTRYSHRNFQFGYKVEVISEIVGIHYANWLEYDQKWVNGNSWMSNMEESIARYWSADASHLIEDPKAPLEILLPNKIRVLQRVV